MSAWLDLIFGREGNVREMAANIGICHPMVWRTRRFCCSARTLPLASSNRAFQPPK